MSLHEKIAELIDEEVDQRLVGMMNEYIEIISKKHGISMTSSSEIFQRPSLVQSVKVPRGMMENVVHSGRSKMVTVDITPCRRRVSHTRLSYDQIVTLTDPKRGLFMVAQAVNFQKSL